MSAFFPSATRFFVEVVFLGRGDDALAGTRLAGTELLQFSSNAGGFATFYLNCVLNRPPIRKLVLQVAVNLLPSGWSDVQLQRPRLCVACATLS
jgi:hypothetical protein